MALTHRPDQNFTEHTPTEGLGEFAANQPGTLEDPVQETGSSSLTPPDEVTGHMMITETAPQPTADTDTVVAPEPTPEGSGQPSFIRRHMRKIGTGLTGLALFGGGMLVASRGGGEEKVETTPAPASAPAQPDTANQSKTPEATPNKPSDPNKTPLGQTIQYGESPKGIDLGKYIYPKSLRNEAQFTQEERDTLESYTRFVLPSFAQSMKEGKELIFKPEVCIAWEMSYEPKPGSPDTITRVYTGPAVYQDKENNYYRFTTDTDSGTTIAISKDQTGSMTKTAVFPGTKAAQEIRVVNDEVPGELKGTVKGALKSSGDFEDREGAPSYFSEDLKQTNPAISLDKNTGVLVDPTAGEPFVGGSIAVILGKVSDEQLPQVCSDIVQKTGYRP